VTEITAAGRGGRGFRPGQRRIPAVRSYRDLWLWLWLGGLFLALFAFLAAIAMASFVKDAHYSVLLNWWMLGALLAFLVAFTCFFGAIQGWPFRRPAAPGFPDIKVEIYGTASMDTEREADTGLAVPVRLRSLNAAFISMEATQDARLTALLYITLIPGSWGRVAEATCPPPDWALPPSLGLKTISMPFTLPPGNTVSVQLVYEVPNYYLDKIAEPIQARLELWDHVTGRRMSMPADIGNHDKSAMVPSSGGAETLGAEYQDRASTDQASTDQASTGPASTGPA
jgi:hypothetical protein